MIHKKRKKMKAHFYTITFLVCLFVGLIHNAMEYAPLLSEQNNKQKESIMIRTLFDATHRSKRHIAEKKRSQAQIVKQIELIFNNSSLSVEKLNSITSDHSKHTLLQEMVYLLLPKPVKVFLLQGVNPKTKGVSQISPLDMLDKYKICSLFKRKKFGKTELSSLFYSTRFMECYDWIFKGEKCWDHRKQCEFCKELHGASNYMEKRNKNESCEHCEGCFLCENRLKKPKIVKCKRRVSLKEKL